MQIFTMRFNLEFRKLTFYGLTRPQSIRKSKQISGQTILSSPQDLEFNPNFAKNRDIPVVTNSVTRPVTPAVLTTDTLQHSFSITLIRVHCNERFRKHFNSFRSTMKHHHQEQIAKNFPLQRNVLLMLKQE